MNRVSTCSYVLVVSVYQPACPEFLSKGRKGLKEHEVQWVNTSCLYKRDSSCLGVTNG